MPAILSVTSNNKQLLHSGVTVINRGRINLILATLAFTISSAGSVLLHIVFAISIYSQTQSGLLTSLFISLQWLPALLVVLYRSDWDHGLNPRKRWYLLDCLAAIMTVPVLFFISDSISYLPIVLILLARGIVDQINRINKTVISRFIFAKDKSTHYASFMQTGYHFGIGLAAVTGIFIANKTDLTTVVLIDIATFLVSALLIALTKCTEDVDFPKSAPRNSLANRIIEYSSSLKNDARLFYLAVLPPLTATFFQGSYSILQPIFPLIKLKLDAAAVSASYVMASVAIFAGSSTFSFIAKKYQIFSKPFSFLITAVMSLSFVAAGIYMLTVFTANVWLSGISFVLMVFIFEFIWMTGYAGIVQFSPKGKLGSTFGISFAIGCFTGSLAAVIAGYLLDLFENNFAATIGIFMFTYLSSIVLIYLIYKKISTVPVDAKLLEASL
jgi:Major Facilitator Superfamily